jgi:hypothetical protein
VTSYASTLPMPDQFVLRLAWSKYPYVLNHKVVCSVFWKELIYIYCWLIASKHYVLTLFVNHKGQPPAMSWLVWIQTFSFPPPAACSWGRGRPQLSVTSAFTSRYQTNIPRPFVHRKKSFSIFPSPAGMWLYILSLGGNNDVIYKLFPPRESLVSDIPSGDGNKENTFLQCTQMETGLNSRSCKRSL